MRWTAEADLVVGLAVGSGKRRIGVGFGIGRRKIIKNVGVDLGEHRLKRCGVFFLKNSTVLSLNWSRNTCSSVYLDRDKAMKRSNVFNLLLQMMPSSHHPVVPSSPDHWAFLEEVDAPQWVDLVKEAALMGTLGDDPWFHRCHMHHETSLASAEKPTVSDSNGSSIEIPIREPEPTTRRGAEKGGGGKGPVSKLIKPALKANVVKACLGGGMQRVSHGGTNARGGRLSSRPRLSTSLSKATTVKKVNVIHRSGGLRLQQQSKAGFDPRQAHNEPSSTVGTRKKSSDGKSNDSSLRLDQPVLNDVPDAAAQKTTWRIRGGTSRSTGSRSGGSESDDISWKGSESPASVPNYRLPSPLGQGVGDISQSDLVAVKSSPSDMYLSSDVSARHSISSQESLARRRGLAEGRWSSKGRSSDSLEVPLDSPQSGEIIDVGLKGPHLEITSSNAGDVVVDTTSQQELNPVVVLRKSLGPPMRVKVTEKVASSNVKKKSSSRDNNSNRDGEAATPPEKSNGSQATHPILEKLRKSWGSALRVKQRHDAEATLSDTRSDTSTEHRHDAEAALSDARSDTSTDHSGEFKVSSNVTKRRKWDQAQVQSEVIKRPQQAGAATTTNVPPSEREALIRNIITRERRAAITQHKQQLLQQQPPQQLHLIMDSGLLDSPTRQGLYKNDSVNLRGAKTHGTESKVNNPDAAKVGLDKIPANHQRSKSDLPSKFKKQYVHADTSMTKSLSMQRGNKENLQLELKVPVPAATKRKPAVPTRRQASPSTTVNVIRGIPHQAAARTTTAAHAHSRPSLPPTPQTSPPAKSWGTSSRGSLFTSTTKTVSLDAADISGSQSETLDRKAYNLAILRGSSSSSVLKLTKQKSQKISSSTGKESVAYAAGAKALKCSVHFEDESLVPAAEDRKSKAAPKYEPRLHSVRAIREWESKSGKRYYNLTPIERQKANQEMSATVAAASKTVETKWSSA